MLDFSYYAGARLTVYLLGFMFGGASFLGQLNSTVSHPSWFSLLVQAGMTAVVAILLLRFLPQMMQHQSEERQAFVDALAQQRKEHTDLTDKIVERHEAITREQRQDHAEMLQRVTASHEKIQADMQVFLKDRGYCPVRDGKENL